jgi:hypothetical protein
MNNFSELDELVQLLVSYSCTLSLKDQAILKDIFNLDSKMDTYLKYHPYLWGQAAATYYSNSSNTSWSLVKIINLHQVLEQYNKNQLNQTILEFPVDLNLSPSADYQDRKDLYDPRFILISLYHLLSPDNLINCYKFITLNGLSLTIKATSSEDQAMRSLAYSILSRYYDHLELVKDFRGSNLWSIFLDYIRASIKREGQQLPFLTTSFLTLIIAIFINPTDSLFPHLRDAVISKPRLNSSLIAKLLLDLLKSSDNQNWRYFQKRVLQFLTISIKSKQDFQIVQKFDLYKAVIILYSSKYCLNESKLLILKIIHNIVQIPSAFKKMVIENALIVWLNSVSLNLENKANGEDQANLISQIVNHILTNYLRGNNQLTLYSTFKMEMAIWISSLKQDPLFRDKIDFNLKKKPADHPSNSKIIV